MRRPRGGVLTPRRIVSAPREKCQRNLRISCGGCRRELGLSCARGPAPAPRGAVAAGATSIGLRCAWQGSFMPVRIEPHAEPITGYRLIERLGGGGFGEVWKCEAPGGLFKAIKFVYGDMESADDEDG